MSCSYCGKDDKQYIKGFCLACYHRQRKYGSLEYQRIGKGKQGCDVEGCEGKHVARGYCGKHYLLLRKYGKPESPFGYGKRKSHPFYEIWRYQVTVPEKRDPKWDDFWQFVSDVGEPPFENYQAMRHDSSKPWGPDNFAWRETLGIPVKDKGAHSAAYRAANRLRLLGHDLRKDYGITLDAYFELYAEQDGRCAICGRQGHMARDGGDLGKKGMLQVDHDHSIGRVPDAVRGLVCQSCNFVIGASNDSPMELLGRATGATRGRQSEDVYMKAAEYLIDFAEKRKKKSA